MTRVNSNLLTSIVKKGSFDVLTWIPTIRGSLSIRCLDKLSIGGKIDRYLVNIRTNKNQIVQSDNRESTKYVVASFVDVDFDTKKWGNKFEGVFRYTLNISVNDEEAIDSFAQELGFSKHDTRIPFLKNCAIGELLITHSDNEYWPSEEGSMISMIQQLDKLNEEFHDSYDEYADDIDVLNEKMREIMDAYSLFQESYKGLSSINEDDFYRKEFNNKTTLRKFPYRIWRFKVLLSNDGLLFLKDITSDKFKADINSEILKDNIVPRVFKMACLKIKQVFHNHYHHEPDNDAFIKCTNLQVTKELEDISYDQISNITYNVVKAKRDKSFVYTNVRGILSYAKSLVEILEQNLFLSKEGAKKHISFIENTEGDGDEIRKLFEKLEYFVSPGSIAAYVVWCIPIMQLGIRLVDFTIDSEENQTLYVELSTILISFITASFLYGCIVFSRRRKRFIRSNFFGKTGDKVLSEKFDSRNIEDTFRFSDKFINYLRKNYEKLKEPNELRVNRSKYSNFFYSYKQTLKKSLPVIVLLTILGFLIFSISQDQVSVIESLKNWAKGFFK